MMKRLLFLALFMAALVCSQATANITITPDMGRWWTYQEWTLGSDPGFTWNAADSEAVAQQDADAGWVNPGATAAGATPSATMTITGTPALHGYFGSAYVVDDPRDTTQNLGEGVIFGSTATLDLYIPNVADPPLTKIIQAEIVYHVCMFEEGVHGFQWAEVAAGNDVYDPVVVEDEFLAFSGTNQDPAGEQWRDVTVEWRIPQIYDEETLTLYLVDSGVVIDNIEVATVCIPAPGAMLLGSLGLGLVGWLRTRRSLV